MMIENLHRHQTTGKTCREMNYTINMLEIDRLGFFINEKVEILITIVI